MRKLIFTFLFGALAASLSAQDASAPTAPYRSFSPADQWEVGVHLGLPFVSGDVDSKFPGFGGGLHVRKSLDHVFSIRLNSLFASASNENNATSDLRKSDMTWISGGGEVVVALNNLIWNKPYHKLLLNAFGGVGGTRFKSTYENIPSVANGETTYNTAYINGGAGISYRVSPKFNIGLEYTVYSA
jgi:OmpA-OmpF porin, OOP family